MAQVKVQHAISRLAPALTDLVAGSVDIMFDNLGVPLALVKAGQPAPCSGDAEAHGVAAGRADDGGDAAGLRIGGMVRGGRAAQDAAGDRSKINADMNEALRQGEVVAARLGQLSAEPIGGTRRPRPPTCARRSPAGTM